MHNKNFSLQKSAGRADQQSSIERGNGSLSDGRCQERMPCNSLLSRDIPSASGFEGDYCDNSNQRYEASSFGMGSMTGPRRGRTSLRSSRSNLHHLKPLNSLESCLMAQLYKEHAEMEEHVLAPLPSPCTPALRPFLVADGTQIISQSRCDSFNVQVSGGKDKAHIKVHPEANKTVSGGMPYLPEVRSENTSREKNLKKRKDQNTKLSSSRGMHSEMQISSGGSPTGAVLFCLGVSVGIISSILANKAEVTKLHDLLKQTENLVQDLQEELEMKDSVTVVELLNGDDVVPYANKNSADKKKPNEPLCHSDSDLLIKYDVEACDTQKANETIESMSTIEAELEAELERLELNMKVSTLHGKPDDDELDPDFVAEVIQGELRADLLSGIPSSEPSLDHTSSSISTPCSPKGAVSPHELTLRLHEVIQSRLERRIMELEAALDRSQKRIAQLQSEQQLSCPWTGFSHSDSSSSSSPSRGSPITIGDDTPLESRPQAQGEPPLVMDLSGEALEASSEACEEFKKINESENGEHNFEMYREIRGEQLFQRSLIGKHNEMEKCSLFFQPAVVGPRSSIAGSRMIKQLDKFCVDQNEEESESDEDDHMTLLIKQIVEKTNQGSPAILHAHRAMVYQDKNEE